MALFIEMFSCGFTYYIICHIPPVFWEPFLQRSFCFSNILLGASLAPQQIYNITACTSHTAVDIYFTVIWCWGNCFSLFVKITFNSFYLLLMCSIGRLGGLPIWKCMLWSKQWGRPWSLMHVRPSEQSLFDLQFCIMTGISSIQ